MAAAQPRKPDWLSATPPAGDLKAGTSAPVGGDPTARVLEFPATAQRRPPTAPATGRQVLDSRALRPSTQPALSAAAAKGPPQPPATNGLHALPAEPAYRSALSRLAQRPATTPAAAPRPQPAHLPSSRLDALLASRPVTSAAAAPGHGQALPSSRLDALLAGRPAAAPERRPLPAATPRLDQLLSSRPRRSPTAAAAPAVVDLAALPSSRLDAALLSARGSARPAVSAHKHGAADVLLVSALPPSSARRQQPGQAAADWAGREQQLQQRRAEQAPVVVRQAEAAALPAADHTAVAPAQLTAARGPGPGQDLQERLRERIEVAKAQIRAQLSPMFRLSEALVGSEQDPQRAADALDAATGAGVNGFELLLARRPASRGAEGGDRGGASGTGEGVAGGVLQQEQQQQRSPEAAQAGRRPASLHLLAAADGDATGGDDVDSLVANAWAAAARAQSALAELASPPRQHGMHSAAQQAAEAETEAEAEAAAAAAPHSAASVPRQTAPQPYAPALAVSVAGSAALQLGEARSLWLQDGQQQGRRLAAGADLGVWAGQLRQQSEALIRAECEKLVASMHAVVDGLVDDLLNGLALGGGQQPPASWQRVQHQSAQQQAEVAASSLRAEDGSLGSALKPVASVPQLTAAQLEGLGQTDHREQQHEEQEEAAASSGGMESAGSGGSSPRSAGGASWQSASEQQAEQAQQQGGQQMEQEAALGGTQASGVGAAAFQFAALGLHQQAQQDEEQQQLERLAGLDAHSPPERQQAGNLQALGGLPAGFAGFGSPIRFAPSPAKPAARSALGRQPRLLPTVPEGPTSSLAVLEQGSQQQQRDEEPSLGGSQSRSFNLGGRPLAGRRGEQQQQQEKQPTPALGMLRTPCGSLSSPPAADPYMTARSVAAPPSCANSTAGKRLVGSSPLQLFAGGGEGALKDLALAGTAGRAGLPAAAPAALERPLGAGAALAGRKDLESIVSSIRRMAAEMRTRPGVLSTLPTVAPSPLQTLPAAAAASSAGSARQSLFDSPAASRTQLFATPAGAGASGLSGLRLTPAGSSLHTAGSGVGGAASVYGKPPR